MIILYGGKISWKFILHQCLAQSTTEAGYVAAKEPIWLNWLVTKMGLK